MAHLLTLFSSPFEPCDLPGLALWLDATAPATIALSGSNVTQWSDKSGKGNHATQSAGASQPTYSATGLNGKPTLTFANDQLVVTDATSLDYTVGITAFIVQQWTDNASASAGGTVSIAKWGAGGSEFNIATSAQNTTPVKPVNSAGQFVAQSLPNYSISENTPFMQAVWFSDGDKVKTSINGGTTTASSANVTKVNGTENLRIGSIFTADTAQTISEVLLYTRPLLDWERTEVTNYLKRKWTVV